jgi:hypothetical protein
LDTVPVRSKHREHRRGESRQGSDGRGRNRSVVSDESRTTCEPRDASRPERRPWRDGARWRTLVGRSGSPPAGSARSRRSSSRSRGVISRTCSHRRIASGRPFFRTSSPSTGRSMPNARARSRRTRPLAGRAPCPGPPVRRGREARPWVHCARGTTARRRCHGRNARQSLGRAGRYLPAKRAVARRWACTRRRRADPAPERARGRCGGPSGGPLRGVQSRSTRTGSTFVIASTSTSASSKR